MRTVELQGDILLINNLDLQSSLQLSQYVLTDRTMVVARTVSIVVVGWVEAVVEDLLY